MLLAIDIGNTNIVFGIKAADNWENIWRIQTDPAKTADEYEVIFRSLFTRGKVCKSEISKVVLSSVVPSLNDDFEQLIQRFLGIELLVIRPEIYGKLPIKVLNPYQIGADLVANAMGAFVKHENPCMVIDFGTALTFTTVSADGEILGVVIAPGMRTSMKALAGNTAQLPHVQLVEPPSILAKNTVHAIQAGVVFGFNGLVDRIIEKTEEELQQKLTIIATGGLSSVFAKQSSKIDFVEENLTLDGLIAIADLVQ